MREYTTTTIRPVSRTPDPWDNGALRDRLDGRSAPENTVIAQLRAAMDERAAQEVTDGRRSRGGRHRTAR